MAGSSAHECEKETNLLNDIIEIIWNIGILEFSLLSSLKNTTIFIYPFALPHFVLPNLFPPKTFLYPTTPSSVSTSVINSDRSVTYENCKHKLMLFGVCMSISLSLLRGAKRTNSPFEEGMRGNCPSRPSSGPLHVLHFWVNNKTITCNKRLLFPKSVLSSIVLNSLIE